MSEENVEIARQASEAFNDGGVEAVLPFFLADAVWYPFPEWIEESKYLGHDGIRRLISAWTDNFDEFRGYAHEIRDVGDRVVVLGEQTGLTKGSNLPIRQAIGVVYGDFRERKVGEARWFANWHDALKAAGLSQAKMPEEGLEPPTRGL